MPSKNGKKPHAEKPADKSGLKSGGELVRQPHGGALRRGSQPGNTPGTGRPPSELRAQLRGTLAERLSVIQQIADGECVQDAEVPLARLLVHARCPLCQGKLEATCNPADLALISIRGKVSASPGDRLKAIGLAAQYGLGSKDDMGVASPEVQARLQHMVTVINSKPTWTREELLEALSTQVFR